MTNTTDMNTILKNGIAKGSELYNSGDKEGCYQAYLNAAEEALNLPGVTNVPLAVAVQDVTQGAAGTPKRCWILRECITAIVDPNSTMESLETLLRRTITEGVALYKVGDKRGCYKAYFDTVKHICKQRTIAKRRIGQGLARAAHKTKPLVKAGDFTEGAWVLRRAFDSILESATITEHHDSMMIFKQTCNATEVVSTKGYVHEIDVDDYLNSVTVVTTTTTTTTDVVVAEQKDDATTSTAQSDGSSSFCFREIEANTLPGCVSF